MLAATLLARLRGDEPIWQSPHLWWSVCLDWRDWWMGAYISDKAVYVCPLPCLVIRRMKASEQDDLSRNKGKDS